MKKACRRTKVDHRELQDLDELETFEKMHRRQLALMPTSTERYAKHAAHQTEGSQRASRRHSQTCGGFHRRRQKPIR